MTNFLINKYFLKVINGKLLKNYKYFFKFNDYIYFSYFYWLYQAEYKFSMDGLCIKYKVGQNNMLSFVLYNNIKNIKLNQLFFLNNPFIFFFKRKNVRIKKKKVIYIL